MGSRGQIPSASGGRSIQVPGMIRHGPFLGLGSAAGHRSLESLPPPELLGNNIVFQVAKIDRLMRENQRLVATPISLRQELVAAHHEMQSLQAHIGSIKTESHIQISLLLEKIAKMEMDIQVGESIKKDAEQAHKEAQSLVTSRQELATQFQQVTQDLRKGHAEVKHLSELHTELNKLRQDIEVKHLSELHTEHLSGYGLLLNMKKYEHRASGAIASDGKGLVFYGKGTGEAAWEVLNAVKRARAPSLYEGIYGNPDSSYPLPVQGGGSYVDGYGRPHVHIGGGMAGNGGNLYGSTTVAGSGGDA